MIFKQIQILNYNTHLKQWTTRIFESYPEWFNFVSSCERFPGEYGFTKEMVEAWTTPARTWNQYKRYTLLHPKSKEFKEFWMLERRKCLQGFIVDDRWISPDYYWFLNYTPIFNKIEKRVMFADVWDGHYHYDMYMQLAYFEDQDTAMTKARQKGISLYHVSRLARKLWFFKKANLKILATEDPYREGEWGILTDYRNFLNENTAWYRNFSPDEHFNWVQRLEVTKGDIQKKKTFKGNNSKISAILTKRSVARAVGGCHLAGELVYTDNGLQKIEDIKVGDFVVGKDGQLKKVLNTFTGEDHIYKIDQKYGNPYFVNSFHKLHLESGNKRAKEKVINIPVSDYLERSKNLAFKTHYHGVKNINPFKFTDKNNSIDPYFLGLWLGDGYSKSIRFIVNKTRDPEIFEYLLNVSLPEDIKLVITRKEQKRYKDEMYIVAFSGEGYGKSNSLWDQFKKYNLLNNKHIPDSYLNDCVENRLQILAGLIDTDGYFSSKRNAYEINTSSLDFAKQIQILATSVGAYAYCTTKKHKGHQSQDRFIRDSVTYTVRFVTPESLRIPCRLKRKQTFRENTRKAGITPLTVTYYKYDKYYGIECEDHLYTLADGTVTHNSASEIYCTEAGIFKGLKKVKGYVDPNLKMGGVKTGMFAAAGAVGELDDAQDLMEFCFNPKAYNIRSVRDVFSGSEEEIAFFFPDEWNYIYKDDKTGTVIKCYDDWGNSDLKLANEILAKEEEEQKKKDEVSYKLWKSQHPKTLQDAFDQREDNPFPTQELRFQEMKLIDKKDIIVKIEKDMSGVLTHKFATDVPVQRIKPRPNEDNRGAVIIKEFPVAKPPFGLYYAGVDPVYNIDTSSSVSLMSITVWIGWHEKEGKLCEPYPVATYTGRHKKATETYEVCMSLIEYYNARTAVESNVKDFIEWVIKQGKSKYLMRRREVTVISEMMPNSTIRDEIGVRMEGEFKKRCVEKMVTWLTTPAATSFDMITGESREVYNVERVWDKMFIREMLKYNPSLNTDRLISNMLALIACQSDSNRHIISSVKHTPNKPVNKISLDSVSPFRTRGGNLRRTLPSPFKRN